MESTGGEKLHSHHAYVYIVVEGKPFGFTLVKTQLFMTDIAIACARHVCFLKFSFNVFSWSNSPVHDNQCI